MNDSKKGYPPLTTTIPSASAPSEQTTASVSPSLPYFALP
jgi:hypothetical protein